MLHFHLRKLISNKKIVNVMPHENEIGFVFDDGSLEEIEIPRSGVQTMEPLKLMGIFNQLTGKRIDSVVFNETTGKIVLWTSDGIIKLDAPASMTIPAKQIPFPGQ